MKSLLFVSLLCVLLAACSQPTTTALQPPEIRYGEDTCSLCNMIISEARFATACIGSDSEAYKFDDIGDMFMFYRSQPEGSIAQCFVHDYETESWLAASDAHFVRTTDIHTPMGSGILAFGDADAAQAKAAESSAEVYTFDQLAADTEASAMGHMHNMDGMTEHGHTHGADDMAHGQNTTESVQTIRTDHH